MLLTVEFLLFWHGSILDGSLKACLERSRMGAAWGWQSFKSGATIPKSFRGYGLALPPTARSAVTSRRDERI